MELGDGEEPEDEPDAPPKRSPRSNPLPEPLPEPLDESVPGSLPSPPRPPSRGSFLKAEEDPGNQSDRSNPSSEPPAVDEGVGLEDDDEPDEPPKRSPRSEPLPGPSPRKPPEPGAMRSPMLNWRDLMVGVGALREPAASARMSAVFMMALG